MLLAGLGAMLLIPGAKADLRDQRTIFTFSDPVEIPGQVLPAGTYVFKLLDSASNRHIVQVFNKDQNHVFGTFLAIPDYRLKPSDKSIIKFHERPAGSPDAVKTWFYPGSNYGHQFVYPKSEALALAEANNAPVPAMLTPETTKPSIRMNGPDVHALLIAPLKAEKPGGQEVELAEVFTPGGRPGAELPEELPTTATPLPLIGLAGLLSLGTGFGLRLAATRAK